MTILAKLKERIKVDVCTGCWEWQCTRDKDGYGVFDVWNKEKRHGVHVRVHRWMWEHYFGPIPYGLSICHRCDNPRCCNPTHLFTGTNEDNNRDRSQKGRTARGRNNGAYTHPEKRLVGEKNSSAKLDRATVIEIRHLYEDGKMNLVELAREYNVSVSQTHRIVRGHNWSHVPMEVITP